MFCSGCGNGVVAGPGGECIECGRATRGDPAGTGRPKTTELRRRMVAAAALGAGVVIATAGVVLLGEAALAFAQEVLR